MNSATKYDKKQDSGFLTALYNIRDTSDNIIFMMFTLLIENKNKQSLIQTFKVNE